MKTINQRAHLILAVCLINSILSFSQPVIKVPPYCEVLVTGTGIGTITGFGGSVGNGGIVAMPDPFDYKEEEGDFYYISNETDLIEWNLLGDISMQTDTDYDAVVQPIGSINPINIQSYNKKLRFYENPSTSQPLLDERWGRSKGRVTVYYKSKHCNLSIKFDILKRYKHDPEKKSVVPIIIGPDCVQPNTIYTYSVDQIASDNPNDEIGFDKYYWSGLPEKTLILYNSTDNSSITFLTDNSVSSFTLKCCYGRANDWDGDSVSPTHTTCISKDIGGQAAQPIFSISPTTCFPTNQNSFAVIYPNTSSYNWTAPNTVWSLSTNLVPPTFENTALTVNTNGNTNPGQLTLTINGGCDPVTINYQIDRNITAPFTVVPVVPSSTCINSTSSNNTYTLSPNIAGNSIQWYTTPASITGISLLNADTPTVTVNTNGAAAGFFTLHARSSVSSCNTSNVFTTINIRPAAPVFVTSSPSCVPLSSAALNTFAVIPDAASYTWTLPSGWTCTSGCTTANPTLLPPVNTSVVSATPLAPAIISAVANTASGCSSSATNFTVNYIRITSNTLQSGAGNCDQYSINTNIAPCTGTITNWTVNGVTAVNSATVNIFGNTITLCGSTAPLSGSVCANLVLNGVNYTTCSSTVATGTHGLKQISPKVILKGVIISPNPNNGIFKINLRDISEGTIQVSDLYGYTVYKQDFKDQNEFEMNIQKKPKGIYIVKVISANETYTRKIIKN